MTLFEAIQTHLVWKQRLSALIKDGSNNGLERVGDDTACPLGQWIQQKGEKYNDLEIFHRLHDEHLAFHRYAEAIVEAVDEHNNDKANEIMTKEFNVISRHIMRTMAGLSSTMEGI